MSGGKEEARESGEGEETRGVSESKEAEKEGKEGQASSASQVKNKNEGGGINMKAKSAFRTATTVVRFKGRRPKLLNAYYLLTRRCNLKCSFCMRPLHSPELSTREALKLVDEVCRLAIPFFHFSGGEPLPRKDLTLLAKRAPENGCMVSLSTNGTLFNQGKAYEIASARAAHFVPDTRPSDRVRVKITRISQRFAEAEVVGIASEGSKTGWHTAYRRRKERSRINVVS